MVLYDIILTPLPSAQRMSKHLIRDLLLQFCLNIINCTNHRGPGGNSNAETCLCIISNSRASIYSDSELLQFAKFPNFRRWRMAWGSCSWSTQIRRLPRVNHLHHPRMQWIRQASHDALQSQQKLWSLHKVGHLVPVLPMTISHLGTPNDLLKTIILYHWCQVRFQNAFAWRGKFDRSVRFRVAGAWVHEFTKRNTAGHTLVSHFFLGWNWWWECHSRCHLHCSATFWALLWLPNIA